MVVYGKINTRLSPSRYQLSQGMRVRSSPCKLLKHAQQDFHDIKMKLMSCNSIFFKLTWCTTLFLQRRLSSMGQTLTFAVQWTSAKEGAKGKLEYTPSNEAILNSVIRLIESFTSTNPEESKLAFKQALTWKTHLTHASFGDGYTQK